MSGRIGPPVSLASSTPTPTNLDGVAAFLMVYNGATWEPYVPAGGGGGGPAANVNIVAGLPDAFDGGNLTAAQPTINTPVAGATQAIETDGYAGVAFNLSGTWAGTIVADATSDDTFWSQVLVAPAASYGLVAGAPSATALTANGNYVVMVPPGASSVRVRAVTLSSGTPVVALTASTMGGGIQYVAGTVSLEATPAANLVTLAGAITAGIAQINLSKVGGTTITIGQQTAGNSIPVILPSAFTLPVSLASVPTHGITGPSVGGTPLGEVIPGFSLQNNGLVSLSLTALSNAVVQGVSTFSTKLFGIEMENTAATIAYVQVFNLAVGSVTLGTTAPKHTWAVPAGTATAPGIRSIRFGDIGLGFTTAFSIAATSTPTGNGAPTTALNVQAWLGR